MLDTFSPMVSIVIPVYNGANYLHEAIDSALAQTYPNIEIIVVNDGSNDGNATDDIARSYGNRIRYFSKPNGGVASALNMGIEMMHGEYFSWLSHDDVYYPHKIASQIEFINRFELQEAIIYSDYSTIDKDGAEKIIHRMPFTSVRDVYYQLYLTSWLHCCTLLIPRKMLLSAGMFPEQYKTVQDYELVLGLAKSVPFVHQSEVVIKARHHEEQGSRQTGCHQQEVTAFYNRHLPEIIEHIRQHSYRGDKAVLRGLVEIAEIRVARRQWLCACRVLWEMCKQQGGAKRVLQGGIKFAGKYVRNRCPESYVAIMRRISGLFPVGRNTLLAGGGKQGRLDFQQIYDHDGFLGGGESASGGGSTVWVTRVLRRELPVLLKRTGITSMLDIPCGDFNWMQHVALPEIKYTGGDIVPDLIALNQKKYASEMRNFERLDLLNGPLHRADLIFCRDCLVHMSFKDIVCALKVMKQSGAKWLLTTTFTERRENIDLTGVWRPLNLCLPPFNFPEPLALLDEKCVEGGGLFGDKHLGLWELEKINV